MAWAGRLAWALVGVASAVAATLAMPTAVTVRAAEPWWAPLGFAGHRVDAVTASGVTLEVRVDGAWQRSDDGGARFRPDPGQPRPGAHLNAESPSGVVVAVHEDGTVWRRTAPGEWGRSLVLLPRGLLAGPPSVTSVAAFDRPVSSTIYLGTDGYSVLSSLDGGDGWVRAGPGLPDHVLDLAADSVTRAVYAGTSDGLWVHHLREVPRPPSYADAELWVRWLGVAAVAAGASAAGVALLRWALPPGASGR